MSGGTLAIMAIAVVIIIAIVVMSSAAERRRSEALEGWAGERGWRYDRERPELVDRFSGTPFQSGRSNAKARHVLTADHRGHRVLAFEYSYTTTSHNGQQPITIAHSYGVVTVGTPRTPVMEIRNAHLGQTLLKLLGMHEFQAGDPAFDNIFWIATEDSAFALAVLAPEVRAWLLERAEQRIPFRFTGDHLLTWFTGTLEPEDAVSSADTLIDLLEKVPSQAWEGTPS